MGTSSRRLGLALAALTMAGTAFITSPPPAAAVTPDPVIIVAGTLSPDWANEPLAARLRADGYSVWIFELPGLGLGDIHDTAAALNTFADGVRAETGAAKVDLVGHSQGGLVARGYVKWFGGVSEVDSIVSLGAPHYGTAIANIAEFFGFGDCLEIVACQQMGLGSAFLGELNAGDDTIGAVRYTNLYTLQDELVIPVGNATMRDGATNVKLQSQCWWRVVGHVGLILDGAVYSGIDDALAGRVIDFDCWAW